MHTMLWLMGMIVATTFMGDGSKEAIYPVKPVLSAEAVPHIAATWDHRWIEEARHRFVGKQAPPEPSPLALILFMGLLLMLWIQGRLELRRDQGAHRPAQRAAPEVSLPQALAPRWGLR